MKSFIAFFSFVFRALKMNVIFWGAIISMIWFTPSFADGFYFFKAESSQLSQLEPFQSDGCSAFPDGTYRQNKLWLSCCAKHDYAYWQGGTFQQRLDADEALRSCVAELGQPEIAFLMLAGVRIGGTPWVPTSFRWGYGWSFPRSYGELTKDELRQVENLSKTKLVKQILAPTCESEHC